MNVNGSVEKEILRESSKEFLSNPWRIYTYSRMGHIRFLLDLVRGHSYSDAYGRRQGRRSDVDPEFTIGGWDGESGKQQVDFLRKKGLEPDDNLFDIGCGNLRAGRFFIDYLQGGNYYGMEISPSLLADGMDRLGPEILIQKQPQLLVSGSLSFDFLPEAEIDMAIAHSVLTHMPIQHVDELLEHLRAILVPEGRFYATIFPAEGETEQLSPTSWAFSMDLIQTVASKYGLTAKLVPSEEYPHSGGQVMVEFTS